MANIQAQPPAACSEAPWEVRVEKLEVRGGGPVYDVWSASGSHVCEVAESSAARRDAALMACAPEMEELLQKVLKLGVLDGRPVTKRRVQAVLKKAAGEGLE